MKTFLWISLLAIIVHTNGQTSTTPSNNAKLHPIPALTPEPPPGSLLAYVHMHGITGWLMFTPGTNSATRVRGRLSGPIDGDAFAWKLYMKPKRSVHSMSCSSASIGSMLTDLTTNHGPLSIEKDLDYDLSVQLQGDRSILGRTLVLESVKTGLRICATLWPATPKFVFEAKLHAPLAGLVRLIQTPVRTAIFVDHLMYSDGTRKDSLHGWSLVEGAPSDGTPEARFDHEKSKCEGLSTDTAIFEYSEQEGELIPVSTEMATIKGKSFQTIKALKPLVDIPLYLVIYDEKDPSKILSCAPFTYLAPKRASAKFSDKQGIQGSLKMKQESPFDPTLIEAALDLHSPAFSYGIDVLPKIRRRADEASACPNVNEIIFNPFHKDPEEVPPQGVGSSDQYAVGDLSGKYGTLHQKQREQFTLLDFNLPLFGTSSVIGRAVVIYAPDGPAAACANIDLDDEMVTTVYATFDSPLQGQFIFRQPMTEDGGCSSSDVYVYIEISKPESSDILSSVNHGWHVHQKPLTISDGQLSSADCGAAGGHFNPFNVSTSCIYTRDCNPHTYTRCEMGDSAGKMGTLDIPTYEADVNGGEPRVGKYYLIDPDASLCGPTSIIGRSIVIHDADFSGKRLTCANLLEYKPKP